MLADIQKAGGIGALKKVDRSLVRDRSAAQVPGGDPGPAPPSGAPPTPGGAPNMADALAAALQKRKEKVSRSGESIFHPFFVQFVLIFLLKMTKMTMMIGK